MTCDPGVLADVPLFSLLDADERSVLAGHIEVHHFEPHQRIYRHGDPGGAGFIVVNGDVRVTLIDDEQQEVTVDEPKAGGFFGFASLLDGAPHQTSAMALTPVTCLRVDQEDLKSLLHRKPDAGLDMLAVLGRHFHASQRLVQMRALRNPNEIIEERETVGERVADVVARFGGSWTFIALFTAVLIVYAAANLLLGRRAWDPYPFILLNLFLSMLAAIQAPVIMMSQNRQDAKDRLRSETDFDVNRRAEIEIRNLSGRLTELRDKLDDLERVIRQ